MTTDVYPRENCMHSPGHCIHSMDHEHKEIVNLALLLCQDNGM